MKIKCVFGLIFSLLFNLSVCYSQVDNCNITFLDSNHVRQNYSDVSLLSFNSDILTFSESLSVHKLNVRDLKMLEYTGATKSTTGLLVGAAIGFSIGVAAVIMLSGFSMHGSSGKKANLLSIAGGGLLVGGIGALIGGSIQGTHREMVKVDFSVLSLNEAREKIKNIFKFYGN